MKIRFTLLFTILLLTAFTVAAGCDSPNQSSAFSPIQSKSRLIAGATMTLAIDETTLSPTKITGTFKTDAPVIYCSAVIMNAPVNTFFVAQMVLVKGEGGQENIKLGRTSCEADGSRLLSFSWIKPASGWMKGEYKIVISVDGVDDVSVPFKVE
jgi:hypothetical protein